MVIISTISIAATIIMVVLNVDIAVAALVSNPFLFGERVTIVSLAAATTQGEGERTEHG